jgi:ABC-type multidrug transport system ATPase subunit
LNGVGKSSFINTLIGETKQSRGEIYLNGFNLNRSFFKARNNIGYCPQFSHLPEFLTVLECLELFADLKGLDRYTTPFILSDLIELFKLNELTFKLVQNLR